MRKIHSKVVGVTFDNEDGENRQKVLKRLAKQLREESDRDELFGGWSKNDMIENDVDEVSEFEEIIVPLSCHWYMYEGKKALYLKSEAGIVGNISADLVEDVLKLPNAMFYGELTGGKVRELDYDDEEDKFTVETKELLYGMNITILIND